MHEIFDERRYLIPFRTALLPQIFADVLVIGGGVAGLRAALAAATHGDVILTCKGNLKQSNTDMAQGGIAAVLGGQQDDGAAGDTLESHVHDTLNAGAGLCAEPVVRAVVQAGPGRIEELIQWGMRVDRVANSSQAGPIALGREGAHSHPRIIHALGDATGRELARTLGRCVDQHDRIRVFEGCFALDLLTMEGVDPRGEPRCLGAITHHPQFGLQVIWARATILATGGCGQVWRESTNPVVATGDGLAMAYRAGARLADMAFMQFHPTTLYIAGASRSLISEAVRGEGAFFIDHRGHRFMPDYDTRADLAPRDVVSRSVLAQVAKTGHSHVFLDCRAIGAERFASRFPGIHKLLGRFGLDPGQHPIPVYPSAHYMIGGVYTDAHGRTNIPGLYACGEVACTGLHGANRLASNSLLEGLVFGEITGRVARERLDQEASSHQPAERSYRMVSDIRPSDRSQLDVADVRASLRSVMWRHVGIERVGDRLAEKSELFDFWARYTLDKIFDDRRGWEAQNMLLTAALITRAALWRAESRGTHYRRDHPQPDPHFYCHEVWQHGRDQPTCLAVRQGSSWLGVASGQAAVYETPAS